VVKMPDPIDGCTGAPSPLNQNTSVLCVYYLVYALHVHFEARWDAWQPWKRHCLCAVCIRDAAST
jgi:hypothetical protein